MFVFSDVDTAFRILLLNMQDAEAREDFIRTPSRVGEVIRFKHPVTVAYTQPQNRVLFNKARDCNPFFHVFEAIWMLAGRNDVEPLVYYNSRMSEFSDDGKTLHGAYGYRWLKYFGYNQLEWIIDELRSNKDSRRCVLAMWDGGRTLPTYETGVNGIGMEWKERNGFEAEEGTGDLYIATHGGKDVPCNTQVFFSIVEGKLDMTVTNRSNDLVWGMLGANVVHFSILHEVMAAWIGVPMGTYYQFTNNLHVYTERFTPDLWLGDSFGYQPVLRLPPLSIGKISQEDANEFVESINQDWENNWLSGVAYNMCKAFEFHKMRDYSSAFKFANKISCPHWQVASINWLEKRRAWYEQRNESNPYGARASDSPANTHES